MSEPAFLKRTTLSSVAGTPTSSLLQDGHNLLGGKTFSLHGKSRFRVT
jgi:hypothetical protein